MLSGDLATLLSGRYVQFEIQPFTFSEFIRLFEESNLSIKELFNKFIVLGGMPFLKYFNLEVDTSSKYLLDVYNTVLVKDVLEYNSVRDVDIFNRITNFVIENIGHTFSANSLRKYFLSENRKVSTDTILNYIDYCEKAYLIKKSKDMMH